MDNILLFEFQKIIRRFITKNYKVKDYRNPSKTRQVSDINGHAMFRRKTIFGKDGQKHILTFAIMTKAGKRGGHTIATSKWDHK